MYMCIKLYKQGFSRLKPYGEKEIAISYAIFLYNTLPW